MKTMSTNRGPGYARCPDRRIGTKPAGVRVPVRFKRHVIAGTRNSISVS
jgi:hypothetical protein